jgi:hypothetical protein
VVLFRLLPIAWAWHGNTRRAIRRCLLLILIALLHFGLVLSAGVFSSRLTRASDAVLVQPDICGSMDDYSSVAANRAHLRDQEDVDAMDIMVMEERESWRQSSQYSRSCYAGGSDTGSDPANCGTFTSWRIESKVETNVACPFPGDVCAAAAITLDSGLIDSHLHLGLNAPREDRVQFRKITTCAPILIEEKFSSNWVENTPPNVPSLSTSPLGFVNFFPGEKYKYYDIGPRVDSQPASVNYTFVVSNSSASTQRAFPTL